MLGDREKCIQAQMDEYLSKPLKQNHLVQTILKCATLGGVLLDKGRDIRQSSQDEQPVAIGSDSAAGGSPKPPLANPLLRPTMEPRGITTTGPIVHGSLESPALLSAEQDDPLARASLPSSPRKRARY